MTATNMEIQLIGLNKYTADNNSFNWKIFHTKFKNKCIAINKNFFNQNTG